MGDTIMMMSYKQHSPKAGKSHLGKLLLFWQQFPNTDAESAAILSPTRKKEAYKNIIANQIHINK
jgi:hypothetical protein